MPIAADEAATSIEAVRALIDQRAADVYIIKAAQIGGVMAAVEAIRLCERAGGRVVVTSSLESGVGLAAGLHLAAAARDEAEVHGLATGSLLEHDLLTEPLLPVRGVLTTPSGPGLGVTVDSRALSEYAVGDAGHAGRVAT
jgi:O-succinylbenzoate synthase